MNKPVIEVKNLSKLYRLGTIGSTTFHEEVQRWWYRMRGKEEQLQKIGAKHLMIGPDDPQAGPEPNTMWALKDVSFTVNKGEIVGIIGKNGAGKSTLLKLLTRITEPTTGEAIMRGRVASLLEVGTGFHPELTGRENVYLNGAILGMKKKEIDKKFNEIVDFAGIETFIDTPVKRYSSGMYVRLAFAVAAHLEPEILLVDEVLAVGDAEFQKKCLGKMKDVAAGGRTVLFVSHNMAAIQNLCPKTILLKDGKLNSIGETKDVISEYLKITSEFTNISLRDRVDRKGDGKIRINDVIYKDKQGNEVNSFYSGQDALIFLKYNSKMESLDDIVLALGFNDNNGVRIFNVNNEIAGNQLNINKKEGFIVCEIPNLPLVKGSYTATIFVSVKGEISDWIQDAFVLNVETGDFFNTGKHQFEGQGNFLVKNLWYIEGNDKL